MSAVRALARIVLAMVAGLAGLLVLLPVLALGVPFLLVGAVTRALGPRLGRPTPDWQALIAFDPVLGWRPRPRVDGRFLEARDGDFHVVTDAEGWPGRHPLDECEVVALGDSVAFGYGVDAAAAFWSRTRARVKPAAAPGYNMAQAVLLLHELAPRLRGKRVAWFVYVGNDLYDNLSPEMNGYRTPFVRWTPDDGWRIVTRHVRREPWTASRGRAGQTHLPVLAALHAPTALAERAAEACRFLIEEARAVCANAGADLVVVVVPSPLALDPGGVALLARHAEPAVAVDPRRPERMLRDACADLGVGCLLLGDHLERADFKPHDDHWTERGHRRVAALIDGLQTAPIGSGPRGA
jgi:hypothetical protein